MSNRSTFTRRSAAIAALMLLAVGCSTGDRSTDEADQQPDEATIAAFLDDDPSTQQQRIDEAIVRCMNAEGFDWFPTEPEVAALSPFDAIEAEIGPEAAAEQYGFGLSTTVFLQSTLGSDLVGVEPVGVLPSTTVDRNAEYYDTLSESERQAYDTVLRGSLTEEPTSADSVSPTDAGGTGCANAAWDQVTSGGAYSRFVEEFGPDLAAIDQATQSDPRIVKAEAAVAECVTDQGFGFTTLDTMMADIQSRLMPVTGEAVGLPEGMTEVDLRQLVEENPDSVWSTMHVELDDNQRAELGAIQEYERGVATAILDCGGSASTAAALYREVRADYEADFLTDEADRLAAFQTGAGS